MSIHHGPVRPEHTFDVSYANTIREVIRDGFNITQGRTEDSFKMLPAMSVRHDMRAGFPLLTLRRMGTNFMKVELLGFLKGITDKAWYQARNCRIWDEWCNPTVVPYSKDDPEIHAKMAACTDLGPIYGAQLRDFRDYRTTDTVVTPLGTMVGGIDQLHDVLAELKRSPFSRRLVVSYWNPTAIPQMALPTCHFAWQLMVTGMDEEDRYILSLEWRQRSSDLVLGTPTNMFHYAMLLWLICRLPEFRGRFVPGHVIGDLGHSHVYGKHMDEGIEDVIARAPFPCPFLEADHDINAIDDWDPAGIKLVDYVAHPKANFTIAI